MLKSTGPGPTINPSMSAASPKDQVFVIVRLSGCWVMSAAGVRHKILWYFPLQLAFVQRNLPTHSGGICGSLFLRSAANKWSIAAMISVHENFFAQTHVQVFQFRCRACKVEYKNHWNAWKRKLSRVQDHRSNQRYLCYANSNILNLCIRPDETKSDNVLTWNLSSMMHSLHIGWLRSNCVGKWNAEMYE